MNFLWGIKDHLKVYILLVVLILVTFTIRLVNLDYNTPFNDEAIYVVVGKMGIFERDWWTYNASVWIPGLQYFYPSLTAIAYTFGGIAGSRFLNVFFGVLMVEVVFFLTMFLFEKIDKKAVIAGIIAASLAGGSEISHYVSRLATYDMPSFTLLFLGLLLYQAAPFANQTGKWYFLSAVSLSLAYLTKIISGLYLPLIILYSYFAVRKHTPDLIFWKKYFLIPILAILAAFIILSFDALYTYYRSQGGLTKSTTLEVLQFVWKNTYLVWTFWLIGTAGMLLSRNFKIWAFYSFCGLMIIFFHLTSSRIQSFDKHILLLITFLSIPAGVGISNLIYLVKNKIWQIFMLFLISTLLVLYWIYGVTQLGKFNHQWQNLSVVEQQLPKLVQNGDKVLVESGAAAILSIYDKNYPPNTTTFDWLDYQGVTSDEAYALAVRDGYFDVIQLEGQDKPKSERNKAINRIVRANLSTNYQLVFADQGFLLYERRF
jgi:putative effector of murein hydrolase LrgA (UPF0299 family)